MTPNPILKVLSTFKKHNVQCLLIGGQPCHFRCHNKDVENLRVDVLSILRGCDPFDQLWKRKNTVSLKSGEIINVISLRDLVQSKKTQRDKDWFMLKRLVDNDIFLHKKNPSKDHLNWWFKECRNLEILIKLVNQYPDAAQKSVKDRPLLMAAIQSKREKLKEKFEQEENLERQKDREYWAPLKKELESLRHQYHK